MHLANGGFWLIFLLLFVIFSGGVLFAFIRKRTIINHLMSKNQQNLLLSNLSWPLRTARTACLITALFLICFAALDPRWGTKSVQAGIEGIDTVFVMDISRSMSTPDVVPSRLEVSKRLANELMNLLLGNRIAMTAFAGFAFNVVPLTTDVNAASIFLNELSPDMIDVQGTNLEDAIKKAIDLFEKDALTHKAIIVFTDGEDYEFSPLNQVKAAKERGISIFTVGIGTPNGGQIPIYDDKGNMAGYLEKDGKPVVSHLNEELLSKIANETRGIYINGNDNTIVTLAKKLDEIKKSRFGNNLYEFMEPQFQYFLLLGLLLLFIYLLLPDRRVRFNLSGIWKAFIVLPFLFIGLPNLNASEASKGTKEYQAKNYEEALKHFQKAIVDDPKNEKFRFNEGDSLYQLQKTNEAMSSFLSLTNSKNQEIKNKALYNYGNTLLDSQDLPGAMQAYKGVLENADPKSPLYKKALQNLVYAKIQQSQSNQNQQSKQNNKDQKKQQDQKKDQNQSQKNQGQQSNQQQQQQQTKPITPSEAQNMLNLIEEEEKKHLSKKEKDKSFRIHPKNEW